MVLIEVKSDDDPSPAAEVSSLASGKCVKNQLMKLAHGMQ
jgi:hypothetical protein